MLKRISLDHCLLTSLLSIMLLSSLALAQEQRPGRAPEVSASATTEQVRFAAPSDVYQMRLEVYASGGEKLFDSDFRFGNLLDYPARDQQGQALADGSYLVVVTVKELSGRTS